MRRPTLSSKKVKKSPSLLPQAIELPCNGGIHKGGFSESALKPLLWGEPPAGCVPAPQSSPANHHHIPHRWRAACRRRGGNPPRPGFPPEGETGKGEILIPRCRRRILRDRAHRLCAHALVVASPLSVPPCFHTHSPWTRPKPRREPGARCHSVGPGLLSYASTSAAQLSSLAAGLPVPRSHPDVGEDKVSRAWGLRGLPTCFLPCTPLSGRYGRGSFRAPRVIAVPADPQPVQQNRQFPRHRHYRPPFGFLLPFRGDSQSPAL